MRFIKHHLLIIGLALLVTSCDFYSLDEVQPIDSVATEDAIVDLTSARTARNGLYNQLQLTNAFDGYLASWQYFSDESDWSGTFPTREEFDIFSVNPSNGTMAGFFTDYYEIVNTANTFIEALPTVADPALTAEIANSLEGEARFARAFAYMYLTQGWTDVPLVLKATSSSGSELSVAANSRNEILDQIEADLEYAVGNIVNGESLGITTTAANALLARIQLYRGDWQGAYDSALAAVGEGFDLNNFDYLADVIFQIEYSSIDGGSFAFFYAPSGLNGRYSIHPSDTLINSYEAGDSRFEASIDFLGPQPYSLKYDDFQSSAGAQNDPVLVLRHAEVVLILAEAAYELGREDEAEMWINQVRNRAGLGDLDLDDDNYVDAILQERWIEFAQEGPQRLWDLRRRGRAFDRLNYLGYDECDDKWPLPQREIDRNPNLEQNDACNT